MGRFYIYHSTRCVAEAFSTPAGVVSRTRLRIAPHPESTPQLIIQRLARRQTLFYIIFKATWRSEMQVVLCLRSFRLCMTSSHSKHSQAVCILRHGRHGSSNNIVFVAFLRT